jgi:guanyl-specific ribonuclease Sa
MAPWRRILASLAVGLVGLGLLLPMGACGPSPSTPPPPPAQVAVQDPIPAHARETLAYVRQHGYAPPGYVGGRVFGNYEGQLPRYNARRKRIEYREWDVRPRAEGQNRGTERLVTGNDGRAWFTADHYRTFTEVK